MADTTISPYMCAKLFSLSCAFKNSQKIVGSHTCLHAGGAHRTWANANFDDVCPCFNQIMCTLSGNDISSTR
jgi:hypothetical protein